MSEKTSATQRPSAKKPLPAAIQYPLQLASALTGAGISLYLAIHHTKLKSGIQEGPSFCSWGGGFDCDRVDSSQWSEFLGLSLGQWGWLYFTFLFALSVAFPLANKAHARIRAWVAWLVALGLSMDLFLLGVQLFSIKNVCFMCLCTYVASAGLLLGLLFEVASESGVGLVAAGRELFFKKRTAKLDGNSIAVGLVVWAVFVGSGYLAWQTFTQPTGDTENVAEKLTPSQDQAFRDLWKVAPKKDIPVEPTDATRGNKNAPVKVVVFSDFECPYCRRAAFVMHNAFEGYMDKVQLVFKHFPLDSHCNPALDRPMHPNACLLADLSHCANRKGKFWEFHDRVFFKFNEKDLRAPEAEVLSKFGGILSPSEIDECLANPATHEATKADVMAGEKLELRGTPAIFINGKTFTMPIAPESLRKVLDWELGG